MASLKIENIEQKIVSLKIEKHREKNCIVKK